MRRFLGIWVLGPLLLALAAILLAMFFGDSHEKHTSKTDVVTAPVVPAEKNISAWAAGINQLREDTELVGVGGYVLQGGESADLGISGLKRIGKDTPISGNEVWHIGSITKSMTASMIGRLVERGELRWDTTVGEVFGSNGPHVDWQAVTIEQLLTHRSGAPANFSSMVNQVWPDNKAALVKARLEWVEAILKAEPKSAPGSEFRYSNVGYTIAGVMAEVTTGRSWETLMQREVFTPLSLDSAGFGAPSSAASDVAWGHAGRRSYDPAKRADNTPVIGPAGIVHMTLQDLAAFGQEHVKGLRGDSTYLSAESFQKLHTPYLDNYASGWVEMGERGWAKGPVIYHNGSNTLWYALLVLLPEQDKVYALATNDGNPAVAEPAFFNLIVEDNKKSLETE